MKKLLLVPVVLGFGFFSGCQKAIQPVDVTSEKTSISAVLDKYVAAVEQEDMNLYGACVAPDADMVNFGAMGAPILGWEELKQVMEGQNAALSETKIGVTDVRIHLSEDGLMGWATSLWDLTASMGGNPISLPVRCTWILKKAGEGWKIVHFHKSVAMK